MRFVWWRDAFRESRGVRCVEGVVLLEVCVSYGSGAVCLFVQLAVAWRCRKLAWLIGRAFDAFVWIGLIRCRSRRVRVVAKALVTCRLVRKWCGQHSSRASRLDGVSFAWCPYAHGCILLYHGGVCRMSLDRSSGRRGTCTFRLERAACAGCVVARRRVHLRECGVVRWVNSGWSSGCRRARTFRLG